MTVTEIQKQINKFGEQIILSRRNIADGRFVNISALKTEATNLFSMISKKLRVEFEGQFEELSISVSILVNELDKLEEDLKSQHNNLTSNSKVQPNTVIAAYQD